MSQDQIFSPLFAQTQISLNTLKRLPLLQMRMICILYRVQANMTFNNFFFY